VTQSVSIESHDMKRVPDVSRSEKEIIAIVTVRFIVK